jgi:hypothetical protein
MVKTSSILAMCLGLLAAAPTNAHADWTIDGVHLCPSAAIQIAPLIVSDGAGGAIIVWRSFIDNQSNVIAQRIDAGGNSLWGSDGVLICGAASEQTPLDLMLDGSGGAIVAWDDYRNGSWDIYMQRIDASGAVEWLLDGVPVCTATGQQFGPVLDSDGSGGAIVAWLDYRGGTVSDLYVQRVNAAGTAQWAANGVPVCAADNDQFTPDIVSDGAGGAIIAWYDMRLNPNYDIYAQRIDGSGNALWTTNGVPVCTAVNIQKYPVMVSDGAGGVIIAWKDNRRGPDDIYAQRLSATGTARWTANGVSVCASGGVQRFHQIAPDGASGAVIAWPDTRSGAYDIFAQRVSANGVALWTANGVPVCTAAGAQENPMIVWDAGGATFIAWQDSRSGAYDIYAQLVNSSGGGSCTPNGFALCTAANEQSWPALAVDGTGGAIVAWQDYRDGINFNLYAASTRFSSVSPESIDFGTVDVGEHRDTNYTIENDGCSVLALNVGETCEHFSIISDELVPFLGPGQSITLTLRYEPASAGAHACEIETGAACSSVSCSGTGIDQATGDDPPNVPAATFLAQNYPNPFNPATEISFGLKEPTNVSLRIFDAAGRLVRELAAGPHSAGSHRATWDGRDANGAAVSSGIYFYRLEAGAFSRTRKLVLLR